MSFLNILLARKTGPWSSGIIKLATPIPGVFDAITRGYDVVDYPLHNRDLPARGFSMAGDLQRAGGLQSPDYACDRSLRKQIGSFMLGEWRARKHGSTL